MKIPLLNLLGVLILALAIQSCNKAGTSTTTVGDGQLHGATLASKYIMPKPPGMIYVPSGTFHMGPSDEEDRKSVV